ncbi:MAG: RHS repeat-associated core domain-containing protein [Formivibrio sp.]|nr:RHS repeat-associated core domain-containing protein [Formivibrio sp.]
MTVSATTAAGEVSRSPSYNRARYYNPATGRFLSEDPLGFAGSGTNFYAYVHDDPINALDPFGLTDYNQQQTLAQLNTAYAEATAGPIQGLVNIYNNSTGKYDFGWIPQNRYDTWTVNGQTMDASQFGNFIAGFEGASYDLKYFALTGTDAEEAVMLAGLYYHLSGKTHAHDDPLDFTGMPDIINGENYALLYQLNKMRGRPKCK